MVIAMAKKKVGAAVIRATRLIKKWEGFMPEAYLCPAGVPTIGYGSTRYENGDEVAMDDCNIDRDRGEEILVHFVKKVSAQVKKVVKNELEPHQMAALISFTYNVGIGNLMRSTLLQLINRGPENQNIPNEFRRWNKSNGKVLAGLTARREDEAKLWCNA
jgi:lysozyme